MNSDCEHLESVDQALENLKDRLVDAGKALGLTVDEVSALFRKAAEHIAVEWVDDDRDDTLGPQEFAERFRMERLVLGRGLGDEGANCKEVRSKLGMEIRTFARLTVLNPLLIYLFEGGLIRPSGAARLEIQIGLAAAKIVMDVRAAHPDDEIGLAEAVQALYSGKFPGYAREPEEWKQTRGYLQATGEQWPENPERFLDFLS